MKLCTKCGVNPRVVSSNKGRGCYCAGCWTERASEWNKKNKDRVKDLKLKRNFGITLEVYRQKEKDQGGVCSICKRVCPSGFDLAVDHDHKTLKVRGLLCGSCNRGIGLLQESPAVLYRAIEYLNSYAHTH